MKESECALDIRNDLYGEKSIVRLTVKTVETKAPLLPISMTY